MLERLVRYGQLKVKSGDYTTAADAISRQILMSISKRWASPVEFDTEFILDLNVEVRLVVDTILEDINISNEGFLAVLDMNWYVHRRFVLISRLVTRFHSSIIRCGRALDKLVVIYLISALLDKMPQTCRIDEKAYPSLYGTIAPLNNHVIIYPKLQSHHQFGRYAEQVVALFDVPIVYYSDQEILEWYDAVGMSVSLLVIHAIIIVHNRHPELKEESGVDLSLILEFVI